MEKAVVILSGGMDSTTLLYDLYGGNPLFPDCKRSEWDLHAISFNYGQKHKKELKCAKQTCSVLKIPHKILSLRVLNEVAPSTLTRDELEVPEGHYADDNMKKTVVPNRNMVMLSLAISYAIGIGANKVFYGAHSGDHAIYPDCRKEFIDAMDKVAQLCDWNPVTINAPYINLDKGDIAIKGKNLHVNYLLTWTCYKGKRKACGKCGACTERLEAFQKAETIDPLEYEKVKTNV